MRSSLKIKPRRNGLRHAFCTYHCALHSNENLTAAPAGNSPTMIHAHYKGQTQARRNVCSPEDKAQFRERCLKPLAQKIWVYDAVGNADIEDVLQLMLYASQRSVAGSSCWIA